MLSNEQIDKIYQENLTSGLLLHSMNFARAIEAAARAEALDDAAKVCGMEICECCWNGEALAAASHLSDKIIELKDKVK